MDIKNFGSKIKKSLDRFVDWELITVLAIWIILGFISSSLTGSEIPTE